MAIWYLIVVYVFNKEDGYGWGWGWGWWWWWWWWCSDFFHDTFLCLTSTKHLRCAPGFRHPHVHHLHAAIAPGLHIPNQWWPPEPTNPKDSNKPESHGPMEGDENTRWQCQPNQDFGHVSTKDLATASLDWKGSRPISTGSGHYIKRGKQKAHDSRQNTRECVFQRPSQIYVLSSQGGKGWSHTYRNQIRWSLLVDKRKYSNNNKV